MHDSGRIVGYSEKASTARIPVPSRPGHLTGNAPLAKVTPPHPPEQSRYRNVILSVEGLSAESSTGRPATFDAFSEFHSSAPDEPVKMALPEYKTRPPVVNADNPCRSHAFLCGLCVSARNLPQNHPTPKPQ